MYGLTGLYNQYIKPQYFLIYCEESEFSRIEEHCHAHIRNLSALKPTEYETDLIVECEMEVEPQIFSFSEPDKTLWSLLRTLLMSGVKFKHDNCISDIGALSFSMTTPNITVRFKDDDGAYCTKIIWSYDPTVSSVPVCILAEPNILQGLSKNYPECVSLNADGSATLTLSAAKLLDADGYLFLGFPVASLHSAIAERAVLNSLILGLQLAYDFFRYINDAYVAPKYAASSGRTFDYSPNLSISYRAMFPTAASLRKRLFQDSEAVCDILSSPTLSRECKSEKLRELLCLQKNQHSDIFLELFMQGIDSHLAWCEHEAGLIRSEFEPKIRNLSLRIFEHKILMLENDFLPFDVSLPGGQIIFRRNCYAV